MWISTHASDAPAGAISRCKQDWNGTKLEGQMLSGGRLGPAAKSISEVTSRHRSSTSPDRTLCHVMPFVNAALIPEKAGGTTSRARLVNYWISRRIVLFSLILFCICFFLLPLFI